MRRLLRPFLILIALIFLFEAWLWRRLAPVVAWLVAVLPLRRLKAAVALRIAALSPTATLFVFVIPVLILVPFKFAGIWLLGTGRWLQALLVLGAAKVVGIGVTAFIFDVTRPQLLQLAWFRAVYERVMVWLAWAHRLIDPVKYRLQGMIRMWAPDRAGRTFRLLARIRRRMQGAPSTMS